MQKRFLVGLILFAWLAGQFSSSAVILPPPSQKVTLSWEYPDANPDIVFNVYGTTNLTLPMTQWPLVVTTTQTSCSLPMQGESFFFVVAASNIVTGMESSFSRQEVPIE